MTTKQYSNPFKRYCCVYGCLNKRKNKEYLITFFHIPKDIERRQEWLKLIDREDLLDENKSKMAKNNFVCSDHFDDSAMITTKRLKSDAVPTKLLPLKPNKTIQPAHPKKKDMSTQTFQQIPKYRSSHLSNKDNVLVTFSKTKTQTNTQEQKHTLPYIKETEHKIAKHNMDKSMNELKRKSTVPSEPTTSTTHSEIKVCNIISNKIIKIEYPKNTSASTQTDYNETSNKITQTTLTLFNRSLCKRKLRKEIEVVNCKRRRLEQEFLKIEKELEAKNVSLLSLLSKLVEWQNKINNKFRGNSYDTKYKMFALNLHYASPRAYRCLQTVLKLPSKSTLNKLKLTIFPKLDDRVLNSLSLKLNSLPENSKYCTICVDKMVLKRHLYYDTKKDEVIGFRNINGTISSEIASDAYVIMLQGIYCNWKQPIAYAFLGSIKHYAELDLWINDVLNKLFGMGIEVKAIISHQGCTFDRYAKVIKNVSIDKPYFFVDDHKIFYIFDVPDLLKCVCNNMLWNDYHYKGEKISWDHIKTLYEYEKDKNLRLIPKITCAHIEPNNSRRTKIKYALQIFSNSVSSALETYIDFEKIPEEARSTAKFIKTMNDLFDVLNSSKIKSANKYHSSFKMSSEQKLILQDTQKMFSVIKSTNRNTQKSDTNATKVFHNFQITIQSVLQLFKDLKAEGFEYLLTRRLNKARLDLFFDNIRQQSRACADPTPVQFTRAFSKLFHANMLKCDLTNCKTDIYEMLLKAEDIINRENLNSSEEAKASLVALNGEIDHRVDLPETNALTYVAGFLLFKCSEKHSSCKEMTGVLSSLPNLDYIKLTDYKAYNKSKSFYENLKMPSQEMIEYVQKLEAVFLKKFDHHLRGSPGSEIFKLLQDIELPTLPCSCFPVDYLLKLLVRLRIFSTLKFNNRNFKSRNKTIKQYLQVKQL